MHPIDQITDELCQKKICLEEAILQLKNLHSRMAVSYQDCIKTLVYWEVDRWLAEKAVKEWEQELNETVQLV